MAQLITGLVFFFAGCTGMRGKESDLTKDLQVLVNPAFSEVCGNFWLTPTEARLGLLSNVLLGQVQMPLYPVTEYRLCLGGILYTAPNPKLIFSQINLCMHQKCYRYIHTHIYN